MIFNSSPDLVVESIIHSALRTAGGSNNDKPFAVTLGRESGEEAPGIKLLLDGANAGARADEGEENKSYDTQAGNSQRRPQWPEAAFELLP
jgi:hypothetical protein